jgi:hypothetical protein
VVGPIQTNLSYEKNPVPLRLFFPTKDLWAQMALATLVPFKGPKKSRFLGPPPPKMPLVIDSPPTKPLRTAPYKQQVH